MNEIIKINKEYFKDLLILKYRAKMGKEYNYYLMKPYQWKELQKYKTARHI